MKEETFKKELYIPFNETYKLMLKHKDARTDEEWNTFVSDIERISKDYGYIGNSLYRLLLDVGDVIGKLNREEDA